MGGDAVAADVREDCAGTSIGPGTLDQTSRLDEAAGFAREGTNPGGTLVSCGQQERTKR